MTNEINPLVLDRLRKLCDNPGVLHPGPNVALLIVEIDRLRAELAAKDAEIEILRGERDDAWKELEAYRGER